MTNNDEYRVSRELLIDFIKSRTGVEVDEDSIIFDDLGIDGLEVEIFMKDFANKFDIDISNFDVRKYSFSEYEVGNFFLTFYRTIFDRRKLQKSSFRIAHLVKTMQEKRWLEP